MRKFKDWLFLATYRVAEAVGLNKLAVQAWNAFLANGPPYYNEAARSLPDDIQ